MMQGDLFMRLVEIIGNPSTETNTLDAFATQIHPKYHAQKMLHSLHSDEPTSVPCNAAWEGKSASSRNPSTNYEHYKHYCPLLSTTLAWREWSVTTNKPAPEFRIVETDGGTYNREKGVALDFGHQPPITFRQPKDRIVGWKRNQQG